MICMGLQEAVEGGSGRLSGSASPSVGTLLGTWPLLITSPADNLPRDSLSECWPFTV